MKRDGERRAWSLRMGGWVDGWVRPCGEVR
uniref:Uncharacterized protein n=1 Tax=Arundo donax TaxID=35708 RepID=A0A0A9AMS1_ARUDO